VAATANSCQLVSSSQASKLQSGADTVLQRNENDEPTLVGVGSFELMQDNFLL